MEETSAAPKVLIVDDLQENLDVLSAVFSAAGADPTAVNDPIMAIERVLGLQGTELAFDLVVVDIHMPEKNGVEVTKDLRAGGYEKAIVAFTAHATGDLKRQGKEAGITHYMSKATLKPDLVRAILDEYC